MVPLAFIWPAPWKRRFRSGILTVLVCVLWSEMAACAFGQERLFAGPPVGESGLDEGLELLPFPRLPADPYEDELEPLPSLEEELAHHGGAHLYVPEGDEAFAHAHGACPPSEGSHPAKQPLRLPESWHAPQPLTFFAEYQGADPIRFPRHHWIGQCLPYHWEPRFVGYGNYSLFGFAFQEGDTRRDGLGQQLLLDLDLQLTGTERAHVQFRPLGQGDTGGSFWQLSDPRDYIDNSTVRPDRYWVEGELASVLSGVFVDKFVPRDFMVSLGVMPYALHNNLLMSDDASGVVLSKNNLFVGPLSNLNLQGFYFWDGLNAFTDGGAHLVGTHASADYRHIFFESSYLYRTHNRLAERDAHYWAVSGTKLCGALTLAGRAMFQLEEARGNGDGELFVLESNFTRIYTGHWAEAFGIHHGVYYANAFYATQGWDPVANGNFNRLQASFQVNPLVAIAQGRLDDTVGLACGVQLFRHHEDESITPEVAIESVSGTPVYGAAITYQRKASARRFWEVQGLINWSREQSFNRDGVFVSHVFLF